ncbi:MAG: TetR/AcrR family transcriptional regulator [Microbacterium sp.]|uniref:TetR/AcrR family transcriptional regulator n=1 Tax=Microbacterium sp. TaxID=51671 RepID=UPI0039E399BA
MPTPERTSLDAIVAAGADLLEDGGQVALTMQRVAERVGVRAPSLYKRVRDRDALLRAVAERAVDDLAGRLAATDGSLGGLARAFRRFAHERPESFRLVFSAVLPRESLERSAAPVLRATQQLGADSLDAARLVTAWAVGFIQMELTGAFQLGGDVDRAFDYGIERIAAALGGR